MRWSFPVTAGEQLEVRIYFANRCSCTNAVGKRVFDVTIDGQRRIDDLDIVAAVGHDTGMMRSFLVTSDGSVDMEFLHQMENPLINAIEVQRAGTTTQPADLDSLTRRWYDGAAAGAAQDVPAGGIAWQQVRGAMVVDGDLVYGAADGTLHRRSFDGDAYGPDTVVDPYNDPYWSKVSTGSGTSVYRGVLPAFYGELPDVTAMTYRAGRLYYTRYGRSALYYRSFTPESGIVGGQRYEVPGVALPEVNGLFLSAGELYYADRSDGTLHRLPFAGGAPGGPSTTVSGPALDGTDWRSRAVFLGP